MDFVCGWLSSNIVLLTQNSKMHSLLSSTITSHHSRYLLIQHLLIIWGIHAKYLSNTLWSIYLHLRLFLMLDFVSFQTSTHDSWQLLLLPFIVCRPMQLVHWILWGITTTVSLADSILWFVCFNLWVWYNILFMYGSVLILTI